MPENIEQLQSNGHGKRWLIVFTLFAVAFSGCYYFWQGSSIAQEAGDKSSAGQAQAMPVTVAIMQRENVQIWKDYSARLEAIEYAEVRPQIGGKILDVLFEDGALVAKGDVLFLIDPRPYEAAVAQAQAALDAAKNEVTLSRKDLERARDLLKTNVVSKRIFDERQRTAAVDRAHLKEAEANLDLAKINLEYSSVTAPIDGRVSRAEIKAGNLVAAGIGAPLLTTIVSTQSVYADFEVDERSYLTHIRQFARTTEDQRTIPVKLALNGDKTEYPGFVHSFDNRINSSSGTIRARALFENADGALLPGMFATVKMGTPSQDSEILLTERAISTDQNRKFVYVVNDQNMVEYRPVVMGESIMGRRIIKSGLNENDKVITEGIIKIRPGMPVNPQVKP